MSPEQKREMAIAMHRKGKSIHEIARILQMHRRTVRQCIESLKGDSVKQTEPVTSKPSKLDKFKKRVEELLDKAPDLTVQTILGILRKEGYEGGKSILDEYVREVRGSRKSRQGYARYESPPGLEAQCDWSPYKIEVSGDRVTIHLFSIVLSYSRYLYLQVFLDEKQDSLFQGHIEAFKAFHGIPAVILYDNQLAVVLGRVGHQPVWNPRFLAFANHYGFEPRACLPGDAARKGKVERPFGYLQTGFFPGRSFSSVDDVRTQLHEWLADEELQTGNCRLHGTTRRRPVDMWHEERDLLIKLPPTDFMPTRIEERIVHKDCMISVMGNRFTVPPQYVGCTVTVLITPLAIEVYDSKKQRIASHEIPSGKGQMVINEEHYEELRKRKGKVPAEDLEQLFLATFPGHQEFLQRLKVRVKSIFPIHIKQIDGLLAHFTARQVDKALQIALGHGTCTATYVAELLRRRHPSQISFTQFDPKSEKPKGLNLGPLELGNSNDFDSIFRPPSHPDSEEESK